MAPAAPPGKPRCWVSEGVGCLKVQRGRGPGFPRPREAEICEPFFLVAIELHVHDAGHDRTLVSAVTLPLRLREISIRKQSLSLSLSLSLSTLDRSKSKKVQYQRGTPLEWTKPRNSRISAADDGRTARREWHERSGPAGAPTGTGSIR